MKINYLLIPLMTALTAHSKVDQKLKTRGDVCLKSPNKCSLSSDLNDIIALTHSLYARGVEKNSGKDFISGSFVLEDKNFLIHKKLRAYVQKKYSGDICKETLLTTKSAYPRKSTHFNNYYAITGQTTKSFFGGVKKTNCDIMHYGIDAKGNRLPMKGKQHILFGRVGSINGRDLLFIKLEEAGLSGLDAAFHTIDLIKSQASRALPKLWSSLKNKFSSEKITAEILEKQFSEFLDVTDFGDQEDEFHKNRKERIPAIYMTYFLALLIEAGIEDNNEIKKRVKAYGVQEMIKEALKQTQMPSVSAETKNNFLNFVDLLKSAYPNDFFMRFGNEIIIQEFEYK